MTFLCSTWQCAFSDFPLVNRGSMASMNNHLDLSSLSESDRDDNSQKQDEQSPEASYRKFPTESASQNERLLPPEGAADHLSSNNSNNVTPEPYIDPWRSTGGRYQRFHDLKESGDYDNINKKWYSQGLQSEESDHFCRGDRCVENPAVLAHNQVCLSVNA